MKKILPPMSRGNWIFWSIIVFIGFNLLWLGTVEAYVTQWVGAVIGLIISVALFKYGPREDEMKEE
jgi:Flp pilus assembly protein protease CpaA